MNQEKIDIWDDAADILNSEGYTADILTEYSGRGMYGKSTHAFCCDASQATVTWAICCALINRDKELINSKEFIPTRMDSLGMDKVYY